jgi:hypothetical protein
MGLFDTLRARLAADSDDAGATPQARDEPFVHSGQQQRTDTPATADIDEWVEEYEANPLIRVPTRLYVSDAVEPGYDVVVRPRDPQADPENYDEPTVPEDYPNARYHGLPLSDALLHWLGRSVITGDSFDRDFRVLLEHLLVDALGRRGTGLAEHVYDDPRERKRLLGLRPFKVETVTAYTREGKAILLRPDDAAEQLQRDAARSDDDAPGLEPRRAPTLGLLSDAGRSDLPTTAAGKTAAFVQYDDIFGAKERSEIPFALDDVTMLANDPDTGAIFGRPESASVVPRATALRTQLDDIDQGLKNAAWNNIVANVDTDDKEQAKQMLAGLDPNSPDSLSVTNTNPEIQELSGDVPDIVDLIQQQVEYVVAGLLVPLYRVGFEGNINRDVTSEQSEDYDDQLARTRRRLEATCRQLLELKATEFLTGHAHPADAESSDLYGAPSDVPDVRLRIRPADDTTPLRSEHFDGAEFANLMKGLQQGAPGGQVSRIMTPQAIIGMVPGLDPDEVMPEDVQDGAAEGEAAAAAAATPDDPAAAAALAETRANRGAVIQRAGTKLPGYGTAEWRAYLETGELPDVPDVDIEPMDLDAERASMDPTDRQRRPPADADADGDGADGTADDAGDGDAPGR